MRLVRDLLLRARTPFFVIFSCRCWFLGWHLPFAKNLYTRTEFTVRTPSRKLPWWSQAVQVEVGLKPLGDHGGGLLEISCPLPPKSQVLYKQYAPTPEPLDSYRSHWDHGKHWLFDTKTQNVEASPFVMCCEPTGQEASASKSKCCHQSSCSGAQRYELIDADKVKLINNLIKILERVRW